MLCLVVEKLAIICLSHPNFQVKVKKLSIKCPELSGQLYLDDFSLVNSFLSSQMTLGTLFTGAADYYKPIGPIFSK